LIHYILSLTQRILDGTDETIEDLADRVVDITVKQASGDHSCSHPRAVMYLIAGGGEHDDAARALRDLHLTPARDIHLSLISDTPDNPKVVPRTPTAFCLEAAS